uniref:Uncharacterized protein n=1 Tax=Fundulus heteroclitus TaxID=8078 RepID=A0A3Q2UK84_FUNHE
METGEKAMSYSDWMSQLPAELHTTPLFKLAIPGKRRRFCLRDRHGAGRGLETLLRGLRALWLRPFCQPAVHSGAQVVAPGVSKTFPTH